MDFQPGKFLSTDLTTSNPPTASLIILNQPISSFAIFQGIWHRSKTRICADGGANRVYDLLSGDLERHRKEYLPKLIIGDLDSLRPEVHQYYKEHAVTIFEDGDQYATDFGKAMKYLTNGYPKRWAPLAATKIVQDIVILGTISGRVDQGLGLLHEMYREFNRHGPDSGTPVQLWLLSEQNVSFLLRPGKNVISGVNPKDETFTPNIGVLPIFGPAIISTTGLEWDVHDWKTAMGGMVSTSNHVLDDEVIVETDAVLLFTIELFGGGG